VRVFNPDNFNELGYRVTGVTRWDDGRDSKFDDFVPELIVCPHTERYGTEIEETDRTRGLCSIPEGCVGYTVTYLTCVALNAADLEAEDFRTEEHCARMLEEEDRRRVLTPTQNPEGAFSTECSTFRAPRARRVSAARQLDRGEGQHCGTGDRRAVNRLNHRGNPPYTKHT